MSQAYNPGQIELEAQRYWEENKCFNVVEDETKEKYKDYKVVELDGKIVALPPIQKK